MAWKKKADIRGPRGFSVAASYIRDGHLLTSTEDGRTLDAGVVVGPQGPPGVNGIANDDAMATLVNSETSATRAALKTAVAAPVSLGIAEQRARLATRAAADIAISSGRSRVATEDADQFTESWADLSAWAGAGVQVSGGSAFGGAASQSAGIAHSLRIDPSTIGRITFRVNYVVGASTGQGVLVGLSKGAAGAAPAAGGAGARGLYFRSDGQATATSIVRVLDNGAQTTDLTGTGSATWWVTVTVDETYITITAYSPTTNTEVHYRWARDDASFPINNLTIMINDSRGTSGSSVSTVGSRRGGIVTTRPKAAARSAHWGTAAGDGFRIALPANYDSRQPCPAVVLFHGNGSDENHWMSNANGKAVDSALLDAGFMTIAAANTGAVSTWGADAGLAAYTAAYQYARDHYNVGGLCFYANSMGSIESLNVLARDAIPGVSAWAGTAPTYDLAENHANPLFTSTIDTAYGGDFATNAVGHDPAKMSPRLFRGIPMWMLIPSDDVAVTPAANGYALFGAVSPFVPTTRVDVTGGHSTTQIAARAAEVATFFKGVLGLS